MDDKDFTENRDLVENRAEDRVDEKTLWGMEENTYCMLMHLSQIFSFVIPGLGLVMPIVMWLVNKDVNTAVNANGKVILNWMISAAIYSVIAGILVFIVIGGIALVALAIANTVFAIIGAVKANNGEVWPYPLSIQFLK